jgi:hypothetical protein
MVAGADTETSKKIGYLRLAMVLLPTVVIVVLGIGIAAAIAPVAGRACSTPNATTHDASGHTLWCNPTMTANHPAVWQDAPAAQ